MKQLTIGLTLLLSSSLHAATLSDRLTENTLVVYNANMGLVHEKRSLSLDKGKHDVIYPNVASTVVTDSVNVAFPSGVRLFSQKYKYDKINLNKLLMAHVNKEVEVKTWISKEAFEYKKATLLSADDRVLLRLTDGKIIQASATDILFESIPNTLITQPSLLWSVQSNNNIQGSLELDYIINNISWKSDYILKIDENRADLSGWITLQNNSGKAFEDVKLKVLAGDVARERENIYPRKRVAKMAMSEVADTVEAVAHEGYHIYSIPFNVNLANNEKTQIEFISEKDLKIKRRYDVRLSSPQWLRGEIKHKVDQYVEFKDVAEALPQGTVRTYSSLEGATVLLGVNPIPHTAKKEEVSLRIGKNFDLIVKETNLRYDEREKRYEAEVKYSITNRSDTGKKVELYVPFQKHSALESIVQSKMKYAYESGSDMKFTVYVKEDSTEEFTVKYRNKR